MKKFLLVLFLFAFVFKSEAIAQYVDTKFPSETEFQTEETNLTNLSPDNRSIGLADSQIPIAVHNSKANEYLILWQEIIPSPKRVTVIFARRVSGQTGAPLGDIITVSDPVGYEGVSDSEWPTAHYDVAKNRYFIVWLGRYERNSHGYDRKIIRGQYLDGDSLTKIQPYSFGVGGEANDSKFKQGFILAPDITFNSLTGEYLVVWVGLSFVGSPPVARNEAFGQRILDFTQPGTDDFRITYYGDGLKTFVHEAKVEFSPVSNNYLVVYQGELYFDAPDPVTGIRHGHTLHTQVVSSEGLPVGSPKDVSPIAEFMTNLEMTYNPARNDHFIVWKTHPGTDNGTGYYIYGRRLSANGNAAGEVLNVNDGKNYARFDPAVEYWADRGQYVVVWSGYEGHNNTYVYGQLLDGETGERRGVDSFRISQRMISLSGGRRPALAINSIPGAFQIFSAWVEPRNMFPNVNDDIFGLIFKPYSTYVFLPKYNLEAARVPKPTESPTPEITYDVAANIQRIPGKSELYRCSCINSGSSMATNFSLKVFQSKNKKFEIKKDKLVSRKNLTAEKNYFTLKVKSSMAMPFLIAQCDASNLFSEIDETNNLKILKRSKKLH